MTKLLPPIFLFLFAPWFCLIFLSLRVIFDPLKIQRFPPLMAKNLNIYPIVVFDSSKEAPWCTDYNARNQNSFEGPFGKNETWPSEGLENWNHFHRSCKKKFNFNLYEDLKWLYWVFKSTELNAKENGPVWLQFFGKNLEKLWKWSNFFTQSGNMVEI